jgi:CheY-like chemotaxis protein
MGNGRPVETDGPVLVIDDDDSIREALADVLEQAGYTPVCVPNGAEALAYLSDGTRPSLILLDLMMPVMDGETFLTVKESDPDLADVPVILITASGNGRRVIAAHNVRDCIPKPVSILRLFAAVKGCSPNMPT